MREDAARVAVMCLGVIALVFGGMARAGQPETIRVPAVPVAASRAGATIVEVERGDHLWKISERRLDDVLGREPADTEVSPYWRQVIEVNRAGLRSGDPDLIFPGEVITLPGAG